MGKWEKIAEDWASSLWDNTLDSWSNREQDINYREHLTRPAILEIIKTIAPVDNGIYVDVGCGDGAETYFVRDVLIKCGFTGKLFCCDIINNFVEKNPLPENIIKPLNFFCGNIYDLASEYSLKENVDILFSFFVFQEIPNINKLVKDIDCCIKKNGYFISLFVHPCFGDALLKKGALKINKNIFKCKNPQWEYVAEYPIVEKNFKTFYLPYFHRTLEDYVNILSEYFADVKYIGLSPTKEIIELFEKKKMSPFCNHERNTYYPEIINMNSSVVFICKKK